MRNMCARRKAISFNGLQDHFKTKFCGFQFNVRNLLQSFFIRIVQSNEEAAKMKQNDTDEPKKRRGRAKSKKTSNDRCGGCR